MRKYHVQDNLAWIDTVPTHWKVLKLRQILFPFSEKNHPDMPLLSVVREKGVIVRDIEDKDENHNYIPDDLSSYKLVKHGQFAMNKMKAWQGSYGVSKYDGIVSPAYFVFDIGYDLNEDFFNRAIRSSIYISYFGQASDGIRVGQWDLSMKRMKEIPFLLPPRAEQDQIVRFLDWKVSSINRLINIRKQQIEELEGLKKAVISRAVTRGLDPNAKMKDSGVSWIGEIPEEWEIAKLKHLCSMRSGINLISQEITPDTGSYPVYGGNGIRGYYSSYNTDGKYLLVGRQGALCGNVHMVSGKIWATDHAVVTRTNNQLDVNYAFYLLTHMNLNQYSNDTAAQPGLSVGKILNLVTVVPPRAEQDKIVAYLDKKTAEIDSAIANRKNQIAALHELKTRLISDAVTGKIDVRDIEIPEYEFVDEEADIFNAESLRIPAERCCVHDPNGEWTVTNNGTQRVPK